MIPSRAYRIGNWNIGNWNIGGGTLYQIGASLPSLYQQGAAALAPAYSPLYGNRFLQQMQANGLASLAPIPYMPPDARSMIPLPSPDGGSMPYFPTPYYPSGYPSQYPNGVPGAAAYYPQGAPGMAYETQPNQLRLSVLGVDSETDVVAGATAIVDTQPQNVFQISRFLIPSSIAASFVVNDIKVGNQSQFVDAAPVPGELFQPDSFGVQLKGDTAQVGNLITVSITNISGNDLRFRAGFVGYAIK